MGLGRVVLVGVGVVGVMVACGGRTEHLVYEEPTETEAGRAGASSGGARSPVAGRGQGGRASSGGSRAAPGGATGMGGMFSAGGLTSTSRACFTDSDCPGARCGGEVCNWAKVAPVPEGERQFLCNPAGTDPQSMDGWCMQDADCKCFAEGARCVFPYCTFTRP